MTRSSTAAILAAFLIAGSAIGQSVPSQGVPTSQSPLRLNPAPVDVPAQGNLIANCPPPPVPCADIWFDADYLLATIRGERLPILVTTSPSTTPANAGVLGVPSTTTLFGGGTVNTQARSGFRVNAGAWIDADKQLGVEAGFLVIGGYKTTFNASSDGSQFLALPINNAATNTQDAILIGPAQAGVPGSIPSSGSIAISATAHRLYTANFDFRSNLYANSWVRIDTLLGYRFLEYQDRLQIQQTTMPQGGPFVAGTSIMSTDNFSARNVFNGVDVGLRADMAYEEFSLELLAKVAGGYLSRNGNISGSQVVSAPGLGTVTNTGGIFALSSNIGPNHAHTWTGVPEVGAILGYQLTSNIRLRLGYTTLWLPNALRSSDQLDQTINRNLLPGQVNPGPSTPARPAVGMANSDVWVHALSFGVEYRY